MFLDKAEATSIPEIKKSAACVCSVCCCSRDLVREEEPKAAGDLELRPRALDGLGHLRRKKGLLRGHACFWKQVPLPAGACSATANGSRFSAGFCDEGTVLNRSPRSVQLVCCGHSKIILFRLRF